MLSYKEGSAERLLWEELSQSNNATLKQMCQDANIRPVPLSRDDKIAKLVQVKMCEVFGSKASTGSAGGATSAAGSSSSSQESKNGNLAVSCFDFLPN